jgi:hypothetical protein
MQQQGMNNQQQSMQAQNMNMQQGVMPEPPGVISTKDSIYLTDMMSWNLLAMKKAHFFAEHCQDPEIKALMERCGQMHQSHYSKILNHMNVHLQTQQPLPGMQ